MTTLWLWVGFIALVLVLLALDLGVFHRKAHAVSSREALGWTAFWVGLALAFNVLVYVMYEHHWLGIGRDVGYPLSGQDAAIEFFTAYLVEKSLSIDNIFVIAMIFTYFRVPPEHQHRVLFWGIVGALIMRGVMIGAGLAVLHRFSWLVYVLGALLIATAVRMLVARRETLEPENSLLVRLIRRVLPVTSTYHGQRLFVRYHGAIAATPLFLALVCVEFADVIFAVDSIPAIFAITTDPFIVYTSNIFAILGLRALYFALAAMIHRFVYLRHALAAVLVFIGGKIFVADMLGLAKIPPAVSLSVTLAIIVAGILASLWSTRRPSGTSEERA